MRDGSLPSWPLLTWAVGLGLTSWALTLQAIVTFPFALSSGTLAMIGLFPPQRGVFLRHYVWAALVSALALLGTLAWDRAWS